MVCDILDSIHLDEKLVAMNIEVQDKFEALDLLSDYLKKEGRVSHQFDVAIKRREDEYPTGLKLEHIGVAIPHTDIDYVYEQSMAIGILENPVSFTVMGTENDTVAVSIIFMLAIKEPHTQLEFLQALVEIFQDDWKLLSLVECRTPAEVVAVFKGCFTKGG